MVALESTELCYRGIGGRGLFITTDHHEVERREEEEEAFGESCSLGSHVNE
jgi:hypothetical protein